MINRTEVRVDSLSLRDGFRINKYATLQDILGDVNEEKVAALVNAYCWQKGALVEARDQFTTDLERVTGFEFPTKEVEVKDKEGKVSTKRVPAATEGEYVGLFRKNAIGLTFNPAPDLGTLAATEGNNDGETSIADALKALASRSLTTADEVEQFLQDLADVRLYDVSAKAAERVAKERKLPDYAINGAKSIIANGNQNKWIKEFEKKGVAYKPFNTGDTAADEKNLAEAIVAHHKAMVANQYK